MPTIQQRRSVIIIRKVRAGYILSKILSSAVY